MERYPNKIKARNKANYYIKIPKGQMCERCKKRLAKQKHHEDYSKPLKVEFLCNQCHDKIEKAVS